MDQPPEKPQVQFEIGDNLSVGSQEARSSTHDQRTSIAVQLSYKDTKDSNSNGAVDEHHDIRKTDENFPNDAEDVEQTLLSSHQLLQDTYALLGQSFEKSKLPSEDYSKFTIVERTDPRKLLKAMEEKSKELPKEPGKRIKKQVRLTTPRSEKPDLPVDGFAISGIKFCAKPDQVSRKIVKPHSAGAGASRLSKSASWMMSGSEIDKLGPGGVTSAITVSFKSPRDQSKNKYPKLYSRSFTKLDGHEPGHDEKLSSGVQGQGGQSMRMRSAGSVPPAARTTSAQRMLKRQQDMLRRSATPNSRTSPSIPSPHMPLGGRSTRGQYSAELESHARKDRSPRHFMEKGKYINIHDG